MKQLRQNIRDCTKCHLRSDDFEPVPSIGTTNAKIMLVGECPGRDEMLLNEPFVGECGKFLNKMLLQAGLKREDLLISNTLKCACRTGNRNRPPTNEEISICKDWLWQEIQMVKPAKIVTLGKVPTSLLLGRYIPKSYTLKSIFGKSFAVDYTSATIIPCYHPSYIMVRNPKLESSVVELLGSL